MPTPYKVENEIILLSRNFLKNFSSKKWVLYKFEDLKKYAADPKQITSPFL